MNISIENFKKALDLALTGKMPKGLNREEHRYLCLGVITEEDFTKGTPHLARYDSHNTVMTNKYITEAGRQKIEAAKHELGDWPDPPNA